MTEEKNQAERADEQGERAEWKRPELHKLESGLAEGSLTTGNDNTVFS